MKLKFEFKHYKRFLRAPLKTAYGTLSSREGIIIKLEDDDGHYSFGEIAPLFFGTETLTEALQFCHSIQTFLAEELFNEFPSNLPCCQYAFQSAYNSLALGKIGELSEHPLPTVGLSTCNPASISPLISKGFQYIKIKIGVTTPAQEMKILKTIFDTPITFRDTCFENGIYAHQFKNFARRTSGEADGAYIWYVTKPNSDVQQRGSLKCDAYITPRSIRFRLDANEGLSIQSVQKWLAFLDPYPNIDFLEQPLPRGQEKEMAHLAKDFKTPLALDESIISFPNLAQLDELKWKGFAIIKPSFMGNLNAFLKWRNSTHHKLIYSPAFETDFGLTHLISLALSDSKNQYGLSLGTIDYFPEDGYHKHSLQPYLTTPFHTLKTLDHLWRTLPTA